MLIIDFDGKEIDIEGKIYKSLKLLTRAIIGINFINLIEEKHKGTPFYSAMITLNHLNMI